MSPEVFIQNVHSPSSIIAKIGHNYFFLKSVHLRKDVPDPTFCLDKAAYWARTLARWAAAASTAEFERIIDDGEGETIPRRKPSAEKMVAK